MKLSPIKWGVVLIPLYFQPCAPGTSDIIRKQGVSQSASELIRAFLAGAPVTFENITLTNG